MTTPPDTTSLMRWAEAASRAAEPEDAANEVAESLAATLGEGPIDLVLLFFTAPIVPGAEAVVSTLKRRLAPGCIAGVSGGSVIGAGHEIEGGPALTAVAARMPGVEVKPFILMPSAWGEAIEDPLEFARHTPGADRAELVILFGDPFSLDAERVLRAFNRNAPGVRLVGGMASAGPRPHANTLLLNDWAATEGGVGIALQGALRVDVVVSQGCRPIGPPLHVTRVERNLLFELDGQPALERAEQILRELPEAERECLKGGLYVGRPARGNASGRGDYLIRNLLGADRDRGVLAVADLVPVNERVRLHVRDAGTAIEDLELLLAPQEFDSRASGALLFSCNGRGKAFFGRPDRDIATLCSALGGPVPAAGFFCAGEIGPVGGKNFLHGHTASIAIVRGKAGASG
ncbi:MAG: FIST signal transduction protein [Candidatus Eiseniibacteriota bacterium]